MISEPILNALLHMFAMVASRLRGVELESARIKILAYLNNHIGLVDAGAYIGLYDELVGFHAANDDAAVLDSVRKLAVRLKALLRSFEKHTAIIQLLELMAIAPGIELYRQIANLLSSELGLQSHTVQRILFFIADPVIAAQQTSDCRIVGQGSAKPFRGRLAVMRIAGESICLVSSTGPEPIRLEGHLLTKGECRPFRPGQVLRDAQGNELYYENIAAEFWGHIVPAANIIFSASDINYRFSGSEPGIRSFDCVEQGGRIIGIMGASGTGKSTLLGILNGTIQPDSGEVLLNGHNIHTEPKACEGIIGFVPQDDLLFEDLTVFQNLYYAARLCLANLSEQELILRANTLLAELGQAHVADLKVGSPLQKTISGGQRKRLNIALELIREPAVLFIDEPTSGLSSADAENVMSLLKEQAARGKLVFVVIHQPSSKIYRMFDNIWILDQGGWPIFTGTPLAAAAYFRAQVNLPGAGESICPSCGAINPEQIFDIIEARTIDHSGRFTQNRRVAPEKWHEIYRLYALERKQQSDPAKAMVAGAAPPLEGNLYRPGRFGQLKVFFTRDVLARIASLQYLLIALMEPLVLGLLNGLVLHGSFDGSYSFHESRNINIFFFMSVIVALFLGLSISAEEICRDRKILRRERFLNLSWFSYVNSKLLYLAIVAAVQMFLYLIAVNLFITVPEMFLKTYIILLLCAFGASALGLNISAAFRSPITIYILIPLLLIPQILLGGVVVRYAEMISGKSIDRNVPDYANLLFSRWGYEALVVEQYCRNPYMQHFLEADAGIRQAEYNLDHYLPELQSRARSLMILKDRRQPSELAEQADLLKNEIIKLERQTGIPSGIALSSFHPDRYDQTVANAIDEYIRTSRRLIFDRRRQAAVQRHEAELRLEGQIGNGGLETLKKASINRWIQKLVLNHDELEAVGVAKNGLYQKTLPIYQLPESVYGEAHFLASTKRLGKYLIPTFTFNLLMIVTLTFLLCIALYAKILPRLLGSIPKP